MDEWGAAVEPGEAEFTLTVQRLPPELCRKPGRHFQNSSLWLPHFLCPPVCGDPELGAEAEARKALSLSLCGKVGLASVVQVGEALWGQHTRCRAWPSGPAVGRN